MTLHAMIAYYRRTRALPCQPAKWRYTNQAGQWERWCLFVALLVELEQARATDAEVEAVMRRHLGPLTQTEVGAVLGVTRQRVEQIERSACEKMRRHPALREVA